MLSVAKRLAGMFGTRKEKELSGLPQQAQALVRKIKVRRLTYLSNMKLASLANTCMQIEKQGLPGLFVEAGCALGGSAILITSLKTRSRPFQVYDVFGMIPPPTHEDTEDVHKRYQTIVQGKSEGIQGDKYYGYEDNLYEKVRSNFKALGFGCEQNSVTLVKGLVQDTLRVEQAVAFAHIDVDWYEPVMTCLSRLFPLLVPGSHHPG
jgi:asparagine synthase (glutamine-hydrolysing)